MDEIRLLDVSAVLGLCAMVALTLNILLGMLLSTAYKRSPLWKKLPASIQRLSITDLHNYTAYIALTVVLLHPLFLVLDKETKFTFINVLWPVDAPKQRLLVVLGTVSLYALITVIITTQKKVRRKMSFRLWKNIHLISYATVLLFLIHGLFLDPELKDRQPDYFDGEKLLCEICILVLIAATIIRYRYHRKNKLKDAGTRL